ncbi:MAG TPA: stage III sporulation protein AF [Pseudogracilibacillus sp.]|nr:stage III sporulation protein AF [Pseudogracilibacillus sp.]
MGFISDWITKIILFMLIGTVIDLLLPSNTMKKYVHFIFGLLFLLLLAQPIFFIFQTDITEQIAAIERQLQEESSHLEKTNLSIEKQKEDIQAEHAAYIWNELKEQYIEQANPLLENKFNVSISEISFTEDIRDEARLDELAKLTVSLELGEMGADSTLSTIKPIEISRQSQEQNHSRLPNEAAITEMLRDIWQLDEAVVIELHWKEGQVD